MCERELETEQNCNILTPTLLAITAFLYRYHELLNQGPGAQPLWVLVFSTASYLQLVWSPTAQSRRPLLLGAVFSTALFLQLFWSPNWLVGGLRAPSAGCWLSLPHLVSNWSGLQTDWICCALSYIIVHAHLLLVGVTNCTHSTHPRSRLYAAFPRPNATVIYTGAFPILTAQPSHTTLVQPTFSISVSSFWILTGHNIWYPDCFY